MLMDGISTPSCRGLGILLTPQYRRWVDLARRTCRLVVTVALNAMGCEARHWQIARRPRDADIERRRCGGTADEPAGGSDIYAAQATGEPEGDENDTY